MCRVFIGGRSFATSDDDPPSTDEAQQLNVSGGGGVFPGAGGGVAAAAVALWIAFETRFCTSCLQYRIVPGSAGWANDCRALVLSVPPRNGWRYGARLATSNVAVTVSTDTAKKCEARNCAPPIRYAAA
jgi:hypothetical protein